MKRAIEFKTDFTIPKKTRSDNEPDLYSQVIRDDQYNGLLIPSRYGTSNGTQSNQFAYQQTFNQNGNSISGTDMGQIYHNMSYYNLLAGNNVAPISGPNVLPVQYTTEQYYQPQVQVTTRPSEASAVTLPKEVPKQGTTYKGSLAYLSDPTMPKVLSSQFQPLFCKLCDLQLSSNVTAKLHYDSKKHNKKVRQFLIDYAEETGEPLHPKAMQLSNLKNQGDKDPKYYHCTICDLPLTGRLHAESHYMGKNHRRAVAGNAPAGRGHFDSTGKWIREVALKGSLSESDNIGIDFICNSLPIPIIFPKKKDMNVQDLHCELCDVAVTSDEQMALHINGQRHRKRLTQCMTNQIAQTSVGGSVTSPYVDDYANIDLSSYRTPTGNYYCEPCNTTVNSEIPFRQHLGSKKHKRFASNRGRNATNLHSSAVRSEEKIITCDVCNVPITSDIQLRIHMNGQKHKKLCIEKGIPAELQNNGVFSTSADSQQYYKYRTPSGQYYCKRCDLTLNTEAQFKSHITGKKHWYKMTHGTATSTSNK